MKYSVIIPIYKVEKYLHRCVDSVLAQTFSDYEIILVDDGSPDNCGKICDEYAKKDSRIKVVHKENGGLSSARNAGLDVAEGEYIYFLDSDDYIKENLLESCVKYMDDGYELVAFNYIGVDEATGQETPVNYRSGFLSLTTSDLRQTFFVNTLPSYRIGWEAWSRVFRRDIIENNHIRFADNKVIFAEDLYFSLCYCACIEKIISISPHLYCYIQRESSIMGKESKNMNLFRMHMLAEAVRAFWEQQGGCADLLEIFPIIYYQIVSGRIYNTQRDLSLSREELRKMIKAEFPDFSVFASYLNKLPKYKKQLTNFFGRAAAVQKIAFAKYIIDGNLPKLILKNRLTIYFGRWYKKKSPQHQAIVKRFKKTKRSGLRVFFIGTEEFGNLGDNQIALSVRAFIQETLPTAELIEVGISEYYIQKPFLKKYIKKDDIIALPGGGNVGDQYATAEEARQDIITSWKNNRKILFPQTIHYSKTDKGNEMLEIAKSHYTSENNLTFFARDQVSFDFAQKNFSCESILVPDIVLSSSKQTSQTREPQILLCMRRDVEKSVSDEEEKIIESYISKSGYELVRTDLQLEFNVQKEDRTVCLNKAFDLWSKSALLITDRLHGMIFAAITGTPCIVLANYNHKVKGAYDWISYLPYIKYAQAIGDVDKFISELLEMKNCTYDPKPLQPYFDKIRKALK